MVTRIDGRFERGQRRRQQLIDAALRVAERDGVAAITHRAIAKEAGIAATAGTYYFPTVDDLLSAVITAGLEQWSEQVTARLKTTPTVRAFAEYAEQSMRQDRDRMIAEYELYLLAARRPELRPAATRWVEVLREILGRWSSDENALTATLAVIDGLFIQAALGTPLSADVVERVMNHTLGITAETAIGSASRPNGDSASRRRGQATEIRISGVRRSPHHRRCSMDQHYESLFIGGRWVPPSSARRIDVISPSTERPVGSVPEAQEADVDAAVAAARIAFDDSSGWSRWAPAARAVAMRRLADVLERRSDEVAALVSTQNGMPITVSSEVEGPYPVAVLRYYADLITNAEFEETRPGLWGGSALVRSEPVGVVAAIVPWNYPQSLAANKYAAALAAGCTVVLKPSPETVLDSFLLAEAVLEADLPPGVINIVPGGREVGAYLVSHPGVDKVSFTGSSGAGRSIAETCGRLLRPVTLELGGKSAAIILDDATLDLATIGQKLFEATLYNNGQSCFLSTRILAPHSRYDEVVEVFTTLAESLTIGDALDPSTQIGPLTTARQRVLVEDYIATGLREGARITTGGGRPASHNTGWFLEPTVFADVDNQHTIAREEIFGPVVAVIGYTDEDDAVRIANDSAYGLAGTVWTDDHDRGVAVAKRVQTGAIGINAFVLDPAAPYGGVKASGLGRELGPEGLAHYQRIQSIYL